MVGYDGHRGWVNYLAVDPRLRRRVLAKLMMVEAERRLKEVGCPKVNLQVRPDDAEAVVFEQSIGCAEDEVVSVGKRIIRDDGA